MVPASRDPQGGHLPLGMPAPVMIRVGCFGVASRQGVENSFVVDLAAATASYVGQAGERPPIRIVLADDAYLVREALKQFFDGNEAMVVVGECDNADAVVELVDRERADVLITDIRMPPADQDAGIHLAARLRKTHASLGVILLSTYADVTYALKLFESGCDSRGYLLKDRIRDRAQVTAAVRAVADGGCVIDPTIIDDLVRARHHGGASRLAELTPRELETLALVAQGHSNAVIAESLVLTKRAVEKHINAIFSKLGLTDSDHVSRRVKAALMYLAEHSVSGGGRLSSPR
jgi:DNA-binding NarL/FixJ family response regulator